MALNINMEHFFFLFVPGTFLVAAYATYYISLFLRRTDVHCITVDGENRRNRIINWTMRLCSVGRLGGELHNGGLGKSTSPGQIRRMSFTRFRLKM